MAQYTVEIQTAGDGIDNIRLARDAKIKGLPQQCWWEDTPRTEPDTLIHFGHLLTSWSDSYPAKKLDPPVPKFYGGMGEGGEFNTWHGALLVSLYDLFQVSEGLHDGDTFVAVYNGEEKTFACVGFEVVYLESNSVCAKCGGEAAGIKSLCHDARIIQPSQFADIQADIQADLITKQ